VERRNATLDILRAIAIILVINCHLATSLRVSGPMQAFVLGAKGVELFFVLSGWLLGRQVLKELRDTGTLDVKRFWYRRWLRTLPAYYAVLAITFAWQVVAHGHLHRPFIFLVFGQNYLNDFPYFGVSWSLCVEEHFYLLVAPALLLFYRFRWARALIVPVLLLPLLCRRMGWYGASHETHVRYDQCAVGVLLAAVNVYCPTLWKGLCRIAPLLALAAMIVLAYPVVGRIAPPGRGVDYDSLLYALAFSTFVLLATSAPFYRDRLHTGLARYVANRAYSLYLMHVEAIVLLRRVEALPPLVYCVAVWVLSLILAEALYQCVERPFLSLRDGRPRAGTFAGGALVEGARFSAPSLTEPVSCPSRPAAPIVQA
jgi:peptidoglycan/LPS O-acetylase OafA/YrhL